MHYNPILKNTHYFTPMYNEVIWFTNSTCCSEHHVILMKMNLVQNKNVCWFQSQGCDYSLVRNFLMAIYSRCFTSKLTILFLPLFVVVFTDHLKMTTSCIDRGLPKNDHILKAQQPILQHMVNCFIFHKICAQKTQQRHEWIISLLLFTTLILRFNMICLFKLLKQTDKIYISLNSTILTRCISSLKAKLLRPPRFTPSIIRPF